MRRVIPVIRPPLHAAGGVGDPYGNSGAPGLPPSENQKRARDETIERYALARGRFAERIFEFPTFQPLFLPGPLTDSQQIDVKSNGDSFVRLVALRGVVNTLGALPSGTNFEAANTFLQIGIDGLEDLMTSGKQAQPASFAMLFSETAAPWFWFSAPPLIRVGETMQATVTVQQVPAEVAWQPEVACRFVDDEVWCQLYGG
jgi:hypothetical protein